MDWPYIAGYFDGEGSVRFKAAPSRPDYKLIGLMWSNTHLGSLEAMRAFMGRGIITPRKKTVFKQGYQLHIERVEDILYVGECMLPYLIIKHDEMLTMLEWAVVHREPLSENWGLLTAIGVPEIIRLYHEEGLTQQQIADKFGLSPGGVSTFFLRNRIKGRRRGPKEGAHGILAQYGTERLKGMYEAGMTIGEIAEELGVRYQTVYMHFYDKGIRLTATKAIRRAREQRKQPTNGEELSLFTEVPVADHPTLRLSTTIRNAPEDALETTVGMSSDTPDEIVATAIEMPADWWAEPWHGDDHEEQSQ